MDHRSKNKENKKPCKSRNITEMFRVKKCLFDSPECSSAKPESPVFGCSPNLPEPQSDSPYALFHVRKRASLKRAPCINDETPQKKSNNDEHPEVKNFYCNDVVMQSPDSSNLVKLAVQKSMAEPNLTGDFSKPCLLPIIEGKHQDLKCIAPETVADLLKGQSTLNFRIFDCRYPYEFEGGHIKSAMNLYYKGNAEKEFFSSALSGVEKDMNTLLIFYCEFSSERAPSMMRLVRKLDRGLNESCYPFLHYPEIYLIEGGYKAFYSSFKEFCEPQAYKMMLDKDCSKELNLYRSECKKWSTLTKRSKRGKTLKF